MIGIFYIGLPRFNNVTNKNHQDFFKCLGEYTVYDFTDIPRHDCPFESPRQNGNIQVWLFGKALTSIKEKYIIKLRSDVWFTEESKNAILSELKKVIDNSVDASFLQFSFKSFDQSYKFSSVKLGQGVGDWIIIANKDKINSPEVIMDRNHLSSFKSGNWAYENIISDNNSANNVCTQLYIVKKDYEFPTDYEVGLDFINSISTKSVERNLALDWYIRKKNGIIEA